MNDNGDQPTPPKPRISDLPTEALLALLDQPADDPRYLAQLWCADAGLVPGTTRVPARELYAAYKAWRHKREPSCIVGVVDLQAWGQYMKANYRKGRGKRGWFYYVAMPR